MNKKRNFLTNQQKIKIIDYKKENKQITHLQLADYFSNLFKTNISRRTIGDILKNEENIIKSLCSNKHNMNRNRSPKHEIIEIKMLDWLGSIEASNFILTEDLLKIKAKEIGNMHNLTFEASNGWLFNFKKRNKLTLRTLSGETGDLKIGDYDIEIEKIKKELIGYENKNIFNMDESALNFRRIPTKTIANQTKKGYKQNKERLTVVFCTNSDGSEKLNLLIIGKSKKPRCLKNFRTTDFCNYSYTKKAWMDSTEFRKWLYDLNNKFKQEKRKIVLLLDNAPSHKPNMECSHIKIIFLPPGSTGLLQPLDAGIIRSFKAGYKKYLLRKALNEFETGKTTIECFKNINIKDAIILSKWAWDDVKQDTIKNCWAKTGIITLKKQQNTADHKGEINVEILTEDLNEIRESIKKLGNENVYSPEEYLDCEMVYDEEELFVTPKKIENENLSMNNDNLLTENMILENFVDSSSVELDESIESNIVTYSDAYKAYQIFINYLLQNSTLEENSVIFKKSDDLMNIIRKRNSKQGKITDFINKK